MMKTQIFMDIGTKPQGELFCIPHELVMSGAALQSERDVIAAAVSLGAAQVTPLSRPERDLIANAGELSRQQIEKLRRAVIAGCDPLGEAFCRLRTPELRRQTGATYTPSEVVSAMVRWSRDQCIQPARIVDPGTGSARFLLASAKAFKAAQLVGYEIDPVGALVARANIAASGLASRTLISLIDYRAARLPEVDGPTLFVGNPPYVRHHQIPPGWKKWLKDTAKNFGYEASQLAGLHVHFFLATLAHAKTGDFGVFITAAEWLDVNYGELVRQMFLDRLGGQFITVMEPTCRPFDDAASTAAVTGFVVDSRPKTIRVRRVADLRELGTLSEGRDVNRGRLETSRRWSYLTRRPASIPAGYVELGELCRVHRGQVTGLNRIWIAGEHSAEIPDRFLFPTVTRARELFLAAPALRDASHLRNVIDLPAELDELTPVERRCVDRFLKYAKLAGATNTYIAANRKAWWSVGLRAPAPVLATYMARRPPAFVRNIAAARHLNIAHGLYPRETFDAVVLDGLVSYLSRAVSVTEGRTYQGGLTKFEPREMERLFVPNPDLLRSGEA